MKNFRFKNPHFSFQTWKVLLLCPSWQIELVTLMTNWQLWFASKKLIAHFNGGGALKYRKPWAWKRGKSDVFLGRTSVLWGSKSVTFKKMVLFENLSIFFVFFVPEISCLGSHFERESLLKSSFWVHFGFWRILVYGVFIKISINCENSLKKFENIARNV